MNEVKKSDIELVINSLQKFFMQVNERHVFTIEELTNFMEPIFVKTGYRQNPKRGGMGKTFFYLPEPAA